MNKEIIDLNNFKDWLRRIKQENNYTAEDLADKIGIAPSTAEGWLYNNKLPNSKYMQQTFNSLGYELQIDGKVIRLDTIYNYLISLIKEQKISNAEFCRRLGFAENYLATMKKQKQIYPGTLQYILDYYNKTIDIAPIIRRNENGRN